MPADSHKNFSISLVATAPSPATSGTSLVVTAGTGALFPTPPFNATVWPAGALALSTNAEIVRVTGISTDTLTITRTQESTSARSIIVGDQIAATITVKTLTDAEPTYKVYTALLTQSGTSAPTATVLENTLGGTVVWARTAVGTYTGTLSSAFTSNKTALFMGTNFTDWQTMFATMSLTSTSVITVNSATGPDRDSGDDILANTTIEIRVYP